MATVAFNRGNEQWSVGEQRRFGGPEGELVLSPAELEHVSATELRKALLANEEHFGGDTKANVSLLEGDLFDEDGPVENIGFKVVNGQLVIDLVVFVPWPETIAGFPPRFGLSPSPSSTGLLWNWSISLSITG